jgi:hypothetical protein
MRQTCQSPRIWKKGFGDAPEVVAETVRLAAGVGLVGCTIEDSTGNQTNLSMMFTWLSNGLLQQRGPHARSKLRLILAARAHNLLYANPSLDETISRLQAFERAGADVLFAPGLSDPAAVRAVCTAVSKPVNFMVGIKGKSFSVAEPRRSRGQANQPCDLTLPRGDDRSSRRDTRGERHRPVRFPRPVRDYARADKTHADFDRCGLR